MGAADFDGDGITDILWLRLDGSLTVFLENGSGSYRTLALSQNVPFGFSLAGVRRENAIDVKLVWYNPFSGASQNWKLDTSSNEICVTPVTWVCDGCFPDWRTVGLVPTE